MGLDTVYLLSPLSGDPRVALAYARLCVVDAANRGEQPIAVALLFSRADGKPISEDAEPDMMCGHDMLLRCDAIVMYTDLGRTDAMLHEAMRAFDMGMPVFERKLGWAVSA
jgi:Ser/Thr protein kinase RdoA (MazF antagonist)